MSALLELAGELADADARPEASRKIAETLGAESLLIFIRDDELDILLPAPGFIQTINGLHSWQPFFAACIKNKSHAGTVNFPDEATQKTATAISYKDELVCMLLGGRPDMQEIQKIQGVLPLLAAVLKYEQRKSVAEVQLQVAEKSLSANSEVIKKLYATRQELQLSLARLQKETKARQKTEKELISQQKRLHDLFTLAPAIIAVLQGPDHVFELANPLYKRLVGGRDVVGKPVREAMPELQGQGIYELLDTVYTTGKPFIGNEILVKLDRKGNGSVEDGYFNFVYHPFRNGQGKIDGILAHAVDVTEQVLARKKVQASEERLRFMAETMPQKVFTATPEGDVDYFNPQWTEYTGLDFDDISNWGWTQFIHPDDLDANIRTWKHSIVSGDPYQSESRIRRHDGEYRLHLTRAHALRDDNGNILMWIGSCTDIEDLTQTIDRKNELELITSRLKEQQRQLVEINNTKDEFIALASHQLRTPATAVKQYISLLLSGYASPVSANQKQFLQTAYDSNERQLEVINGLLKTAQLDSNRYTLDKKPHAISGLLQEAIDELQPTLTFKKQTVVQDGMDEQCTVLVDRAEIKLAISNLLENASKYSYPGGTITVKLRKTNRNIIIEVTDSGVGISTDNIQRIFEKFTRIDNELSDTVTGTGLGLYWVKQIVGLHGGSVRVNSTLGKGSSFIVSLPL